MAAIFQSSSGKVLQSSSGKIVEGTGHCCCNPCSFCDSGTEPEILEAVFSGITSNFALYACSVFDGTSMAYNPTNVIAQKTPNTTFVLKRGGGDGSISWCWWDGVSETFTISYWDDLTDCDNETAADGTVDVRYYVQLRLYTSEWGIVMQLERVSDGRTQNVFYYSTSAITSPIDCAGAMPLVISSSYDDPNSSFAGGSVTVDLP